MRKQLLSLTVLVAGVAMAGSEPARAGTSAPVVLGSYYEQTAINCTNPLPVGSSSGSEDPRACQLLFSAPPAGKQLRLDNVACAIRIGEVPLQDLYLAQNVNGTITRKHPLDPTPQGNYNGVSFYTLNEDAGGYLVTAPVRVVVDIPASRSVGMDCQIIGTLQNVSAP